jgi:tetratricopeptide (TPR) repeat protein
MPLRPLVVLSIVLVLSHSVVVIAQKSASPPKSSLCTRQNTLDTINQQILGSRTFDKAIPRIAVLIRAADVLWPHDKEKARATFIEAFDLAAQDFKENGDVVGRTSASQYAARIPAPDQRYKVITAYAKRDSAAARKLTEQIAQEDMNSVDTNTSAGIESSRKAFDKIVSVAFSMLPADEATATTFARASFRYAATLSLPRFLFKLAATNQAAADQLYTEALSAYGSTPMDQFLYLSSYPFGNTREAGEMTSYAFNQIPEGFTPRINLQQMFTQRLLARGQMTLEMSAETVPNQRWSDQAQMWMALSRLEKQIATNLPDLADSAVQTRDKLYSLLNPAVQKRANGTIGDDNPAKKSFDERVEAAEKLANVDDRDRDLTFAITGASKDETVERVVSVIDKISDSGVRDSLSNWYFFFKTQAVLKDKNFDEARKLAGRVTELDQRVYLFTKIAEATLKENEDQTQTREMLNAIAADAAKAPKSIVTARALLALAHLYAKIDTIRGIEELANAVRVINNIEKPDFSQQFVMMKIEGKAFGSYAAFQTPGFNPETAFAEMSKLDFDGTLSQASSFTDKSLRSLTTISVVEPCLVPATKPSTTTKSPKAKP